MQMINYETFIAERIAKLRIQKNISARDMSLSIGQSANYINMIENKKSLPSMTVFFLICEYFNIKPNEFFDEHNYNPSKLNEIIDSLKYLDEDIAESLLNIISRLKKNG